MFSWPTGPTMFQNACVFPYCLYHCLFVAKNQKCHPVKFCWKHLEITVREIFSPSRHPRGRTGHLQRLCRWHPWRFTNPSWSQSWESWFEISANPVWSRQLHWRPPDAPANLLDSRIFWSYEIWKLLESRVRLSHHFKNEKYLSVLLLQERQTL